MHVLIEIAIQNDNENKTKSNSQIKIINFKNIK